MYRAGRLASALAGLIALSSCADEGPVESFELSGFVHDDLTGEGIDDATVTFVSDTLFEASTTTSGNGFYEMGVETDVPFGQVRAEKEGYRPAEATVFFDTNVRRIDLRMRPSE